jgi:hypothetical protein
VKHYIVWNDTLITYPKGIFHEVSDPSSFVGCLCTNQTAQGMQILDGFHGSMSSPPFLWFSHSNDTAANIYVHGPAVAQKIKERLLGIEGDDTERSNV